MGEEPVTIPPTVSAAPDVIAYTLTRWERFRSLVWMQTRSRVVRIFAACVVLVSVWLAFRNGEGDSFAVKLISAIFQFVLLSAVGIGALVLTAFMTAFLTTDRSVVGAITLTFSDDGFNAESPVGKTFFKWTGLRSIQVANGFIYLRISDSKFLGIPERAFPDQRTASHFADSLLRRLQTATTPALRRH